MNCLDCGKEFKRQFRMQWYCEPCRSYDVKILFRNLKTKVQTMNELTDGFRQKQFEQRSKASMMGWALRKERLAREQNV